MGTFPDQGSGEKKQARRESIFSSCNLERERNKFFTREDCVNSAFGWSHRVGEAKKGIFVLPYPSQSTIAELGLFALARDSLLERTRRSRD